MGKRSNFKRRKRDAYPTPPAAIDPLLPFLPKGTHFWEPCAGDGRLRDYLVAKGHVCVGASDIKPRGRAILERSAIRLRRTPPFFITNPPWDRELLHAIISNLAALAPTWLLIDADWMQTRQAAPYLSFCSSIVSIGRVKWFARSKFTGKDNCCWYYFDAKRPAWPRFYGRV